MLELLGVKLSAMMAGFCGSTVYLVSVPPLGAFRMFCSVAASVLCATYLSPLVSEIFKLATKIEAGVAFFIGLIAMAVVPGLLKNIAAASADPASAIKKYRGK